MSTILKALRRLEEEKTTVSEGRPLREEVASRAPGAQGPVGARRWAPAAGALLLGLLAGGVAFWAVNALLAPERSRDPDRVATGGTPGSVASPSSSPSSPQTPQETAPAPPRPAPRAAVAAAAPDGPPDDAYASEVAVVPRRETAPRIADAEPIEPRRGERPGSRRPVESSSAAARARELAEMRRALEAARAERVAVAAPSAGAAEETSAPSGGAADAPARVERGAASSPAPEPATRSQPAPGPETGAAVARAGSTDAQPSDAPRSSGPAAEPEPPAAEPAPEPTAAAETTRAEPPAPAAEPAVAAEPEAPSPPPEASGADVALRVERTEWHPLPDRRRAWVAVDAAEPRTVVEGDVVGGLVVSKIEPSGVVFERDGESLHRRVGAAE